jgi:RNA polymerase-interacting CarD/CdnL/TRCF family regulator
MITVTFAPGDSVFHPRYGFGTIVSLARRDPDHPWQDADSSEALDYYDIQLLKGGSLLVPINRAASVGLRALTNSLEVVKLCLCSPARSLPENHRERAAALRVQGENTEPMALAYSVRDLLAQGRNRSLSASEKTWLDKSCERLITEASLVDHISVVQARAAIQEAMKQVNTGQPDPEGAK